MATAGPDAGSRRDEVVVSLRSELDIVSMGGLGLLAAAAIRGQFVVVDLAGLDFIDCRAVRLIMHAQVVARESGGDVVFANSPGSVLSCLTMPGQADVPAEALAAG